MRRTLYLFINYFIFSRLSEQSRLTAEHKRLLQLIKEKYDNSVDWNHKYQALILNFVMQVIYFLF